MADTKPTQETSIPKNVGTTDESSWGIKHTGTGWEVEHRPRPVPTKRDPLDRTPDGSGFSKG